MLPDGYSKHRQASCTSLLSPDWSHSFSAGCSVTGRELNPRITLTSDTTSPHHITAWQPTSMAGYMSPLGVRAFITNTLDGLPRACRTGFGSMLPRSRHHNTTHSSASQKRMFDSPSCYVHKAQLLLQRWNVTVHTLNTADFTQWS